MPEPVTGKYNKANQRGQTEGTGDFKQELRPITEIFRPENGLKGEPGQGQKHQHDDEKDHPPQASLFPFCSLDFLPDLLAISGFFPAHQGL